MCCEISECKYIFKNYMNNGAIGRGGGGRMHYVTSIRYVKLAPILLLPI